MLTIHCDEIAALVGGGVSHGDGGITDHELGLGIDLVRDGALVLKLVDVTYDDITGNGVRGNREGKLTAGLAVELGDIDSTSEDDLADIVQILAPDSDNITGKDGRRSERAENNRLCVLQVKSCGSGCSIATYDSDRADLRVHGDDKADLAAAAGGDGLDAGY